MHRQRLPCNGSKGGEGGGFVWAAERKGARVRQHQGVYRAALLVAVCAGVGKIGSLTKHATVADADVKTVGSNGFHTRLVGSMEQPRLPAIAQLWSSCLQHAQCLSVTLLPVVLLLLSLSCECIIANGCYCHCYQRCDCCFCCYF